MATANHHDPPHDPHQDPYKHSHLAATARQRPSATPTGPTMAGRPLHPWFWPGHPTPPRQRQRRTQHVLQTHMSMADLSTPFPLPPPSPALSSESSSTVMHRRVPTDPSPLAANVDREAPPASATSAEWSRNPWRRDPDHRMPNCMTMSMTVPAPTAMYVASPAMPARSPSPGIAAGIGIGIRTGLAEDRGGTDLSGSSDDQSFGVPLNSPPPTTLMMEGEREWEREQECLKENVRKGSAMADLLDIFGDASFASPALNPTADQPIESRSQQQVQFRQQHYHHQHDDIPEEKDDDFVMVSPPGPVVARSTELDTRTDDLLLDQADPSPASFYPRQYQPHTTTSFSSAALLGPISPPEPAMERPAESVVEMPQIAITIITSAIIQQATRVIPSILTRIGWPADECKLIYAWAIQNPKVTLLFWMCDDIAKWRSAAMYQLRDDMLPLSEDELRGVASEPEKIMKNQWRVMCKELPRTHGHVDFGPGERLPLHSFGAASRDRHGRSRTDSPEDALDRVCWLSDSAGPGRTGLYVRKRFRMSLSFHPGAALRQVAKFRVEMHPNIDRIVCSYSLSHTFAIITDVADLSLADYLNRSIGSSPSATPNTADFPDREHRLLGWISDLASAVTFLHQQHICHRSLRPRKILIRRGRIYLSVFGVGEEAMAGRLDYLDSSSESRLEGYVFAAPEMVQHRPARPGTTTASTQTITPVSTSRADVFSLGCVFLAMISNVRGYRQSDFTAFRTGSGSDPSFHANGPRVDAWIRQLRGARISDMAAFLNSGTTDLHRSLFPSPPSSSNTPPVSTTPVSSNHPFGDSESKPMPNDADLAGLLYWMKQMIAADPGQRRKMKRVIVGINDWNSERERKLALSAGRRNSFTGPTGGWADSRPPIETPTPTQVAMHIQLQRLLDRAAHPMSPSSSSSSSTIVGSACTAATLVPTAPPAPPALTHPPIQSSRPRLMGGSGTTKELRRTAAVIGRGPADGGVELS